jgi:dimeric dUTPase (all-alpha-NTP-PPase superfamily)
MDFTEPKVIKLRLIAMLVLQDKINSQINPQWKIAGNPWYRAIWTESAELLDHIGWKWWKKSQLNIPQAQLEVVDIFHFGLSDLLQKYGSAQDTAEATLASFSELDQIAERHTTCDAPALALMVEEFAHHTLAEKQFDLSRFVSLCICLQMNSADLHLRYVSKNVLNAFRQNNGYRDGTYIKVWAGREDNEWLEDLASSITQSPDNFPDALYEALTACYQQKKGP